MGFSNSAYELDFDAFIIWGLGVGLLLSQPQRQHNATQSQYCCRAYKVVRIYAESPYTNLPEKNR